MRSEFEKLAAAGKIEGRHVEPLTKLAEGGCCTHRSWGFGKIKTVATVFARFTIEFAGKPGHTMDLAKIIQDLLEDKSKIERVIAEAVVCDAAILGIPAMDTVKEVKRATPQSGNSDVALITATIPRERVVLAQTPQVFRASLLLEAFARARQDGVSASDEAGLVERIGHDVHVVAGSDRNLKITRPGDMQLAEFYLREERAAR